MGPLTQSTTFDNFQKTVLCGIQLRAFRVEKINSEHGSLYLIRWAVEGPDSGFDLFLNNKIIPDEGVISVHDLNVKKYELTAKSGRFYRLLSTLTINANLAQWSPAELYLRKYMLPLAVKAIDSNPNLSVGNRVTEGNVQSDIQFSGGKMYLKFPVKLRMPFIPNASAMIHLSFDVSEKENQTLMDNLKVSLKIRYAFLYKLLLRKKTRCKKMQNIHVCFHQLLKRIELSINVNRSKTWSEKLPPCKFSDSADRLVIPGNTMKVAEKAQLNRSISDHRMDKRFASAG